METNQIIQPDRRLLINYPIPQNKNLPNAFFQRHGKFQNPYDEFIDIASNNFTWAAYHLLKWKSKPLRLAPFQSVIIDFLWEKTFPILLASRGASKTFTMGTYAVIHAIFAQGSKIVIVSNSFRQSKLVFDVIEELYNNSPILQACCPLPPSKPNDSRELRIGDSIIKAIPLGNGERIRGIRGNVILCDEFASINPEIFQVVVRGFAAVSADPVDTAHQISMQEEMVRKGLMNKEDIKKSRGNKIIYSGTANFQFNHFYKLYQTHKNIIENKISGSSKDFNKQMGIEDEDGVEETLDWRDYGIIQIPYYGLPKGFMDDKQITQAKTTMTRALFEMEYCCVFPTDSDGFFRRSLINEATPGYNKNGTAFGVELKGDPGFEYVMGIDPARRTDNFSICILKLMKDGTRRLVYVYSMNRKSWPDATRKVRELLRKFNVVRIAMDAGGGGTNVEDLLQDQKHLEPGELQIWRWNEPEHKMFRGLHILEMVNFTSSWIRDANYGLASDIEHCRLLFPYKTKENASEEQEEIWEEHEEQLKEICHIVVSSTKTGVEHFDLPDSTQGSTLKVVQRKDRYSALLLADHAARNLHVEERKVIRPSTGGWAHLL